MKGLIIIFIIGFISIIVLILVLFLTKSFKPKTYEIPIAKSFTDQYEVPAMWLWPDVDLDGNFILDPDGNYTFKDLTPSVPVDGPEGECQIYSIKPIDPYIPGFPSINKLDSCISGAVCNKPQTWFNTSCIDDDQIYVKKVKHMCTNVKNDIIKVADKCLGRNGILYEKGEIEEYYVECEGIELCTESSFGFISFGETGSGNNTFQDVKCLAITNYDEKIKPGDVNFDTCDMTNLDEYDFSSVLLKVERAAYVNGNYISNTGGNFIRLIHRPTGKYIIPNLTDNDIYQPILREGLKLVNPKDKSITKNPSGYWWVVIPQIEDPKINSGGIDVEVLGVKQYIYYIPNPINFPTNINNTTLWEYIIKYQQYIISNVDNKPFISGVILYNTKNTNTDNARAAKKSSVSFFDYPILPLIINNPSQYSF